jgi:hypothetical protein
MMFGLYKNVTSPELSNSGAVGSHKVLRIWVFICFEICTYRSEFNGTKTIE